MTSLQIYLLWIFELGNKYGREKKNWLKRKFMNSDEFNINTLMVLICGFLIDIILLFLTMGRELFYLYFHLLI